MTIKQPNLHFKILLCACALWCTSTRIGQLPILLSLHPCQAANVVSTAFYLNVLW